MLCKIYSEFKIIQRDAWVAQQVEHLPLAQAMIPDSWDQVPRQAPCMEPASPFACDFASFSLSLSLMNK